MRLLFISFIFFIIFTCSHVMAKTMTVATGQGYESYNGQVIAYYSFTPGNYEIANDINYTETNSIPNETINYTAACAYMKMYNSNLSC
jgi:hypothetical protein